MDFKMTVPSYSLSAWTTQKLLLKGSCPLNSKWELVLYNRSQPSALVTSLQNEATFPFLPTLFS